MSDIPDEVTKAAHHLLNELAMFDPEEHAERREIIARALMEAEARGRKHGPMLCTSCGTVCSTGRCDCTDMGRENLSMRVRYIAHLHSELDRADEREALALAAERKRALEEAATALVEMAKMTALAAKHADNAIGRSAGQFGAEVLQEAAAAIRKLGEG